MIGYQIAGGALCLAFCGEGRLQAAFSGGVNAAAGSAAGGWLALKAGGVEYTRREDFVLQNAQQAAHELCLVYTTAQGALEVTCHLRDDGEGIRVAAKIRVLRPVGLFEWLEFRLPSLAFEGAARDRFYAPCGGSCFEITSGNLNFRPGGAAAELAAFPTAEDMFSTAPDKGPGLLVLEAPAGGQAIGLYSWSQRENIFPLAGVAEGRTSLAARHMVCFDTARFTSLGVGETVFLGGSYMGILDAYNRFINRAVKVPDVPAWALEGAVLEVHAAQLGGFAAAVAQLGRFKAMGIKTLYLMPCLHFPEFMEEGGYVHGLRMSGAPYSVLDYYKISDSLGGEAAFRAFVAALHENGMRLLFDLVPQGASVYGDLYRQKPGWFSLNEKGEHHSSHGWDNTYSLDWANPEVQQFFVDIACHYVRDFDVDGFRVDAPHWKEPNLAPGLPYHASQTCFGSLEIIRRVLEETRAIKPDVFLLNEVWGPCFTGITHMQCDYNYHWMLYNVALGRYTGADMAAWLREYYKTQPEGSGKVVFLETHDTRLLTPPAERLRGARALRCCMDAAVFMGCLPMVWYDELPEQEAYYTGLLALRREGLARLEEGPADLGTVESGHGEVFAASRPGRHPWVLLVNFDRALVECTPRGLEALCPDAEGEWTLYNLRDNTPLTLYSREGGAGSKVRARTRVPAEELSRLTLHLEPFKTYWLELRPAQAE